MESHFNYLLEHFGYVGLILALVLGIIGVPIPDEVLLTYVGYIVSQGKMSYLFSLISACSGAIAGISISYLLGNKLGTPFLEKFGPKIHLTEKRIDYTKRLFNKVGPFLLFIGYFIPGVRHITAYLAGINALPYKKFAIYAYSGAIFWGFTFITLGKKLGDHWMKVQYYMSYYSVYFILFVIITFIVGYLYWIKKDSKET
ncbi:DedA family protein [Halalkalibacterium ligniniphilum]|uniref:DedA family protein n=1 Tax=Halalkalibacterium ligniniphilum TaxID=1134413 RepID=UPI00034AED0A|nr:DedA family protein [Halalkalibacterium ligniniphilum]